MKLKPLFAIFLVSGFYFCLNSCTDEGYKVTPNPVNLTLEGNGNLGPVATLGKILFYDTHLSVNDGISCASCHKQAFAFSDNKTFSSGFENKLTTRNAPPIQNLADHVSLFWDGREQLLTSMVLKPILNHVEMGMDDEDALVERVRNQSYYHDFFLNAFGSADVTSVKIAQVLAEFIKLLRPANTRFDSNNLTALEAQGKQLFNEKYNCNGCHNATAGSGGGYYGGGGFTTSGFKNIGLDINYTDPGRENVTHDPADEGKFKIPNLRNVALTAPYMHDGRFATLDEVLEHYSHGIKNNVNLDSLLKDTGGMPLHLNITQEEKTALIAFLNTMTDYTMISNKEFSNPFH